MKTISVVIPTFNEQGNIMDSYYQVKNIFTEQLCSNKLRQKKD